MTAVCQNTGGSSGGGDSSDRRSGSTSTSCNGSSCSSSSASSSKRFLKLHGRGGWLLTLHGGRAVVQRVIGAPAEDVGRFVYRVVAEGGAEVRHGPTATAPLLGCTLPVATELTATLRLRFPREVLLSSSSSSSSEASRGAENADGETRLAAAAEPTAADHGVFVSFVLPEGTRVVGSERPIPSNNPIPGWLQVVDDQGYYQESFGDESNCERWRSSRRVTPLLELVSEEVSRRQ